MLFRADGQALSRSVCSVHRDQSGLAIEGPTVADKSPRQSMAKKSGQSLKQKRADKRAKTDNSGSLTEVIQHKKR
jgi:hypothetical protein